LRLVALGCDRLAAAALPEQLPIARSMESGFWFWTRFQREKRIMGRLASQCALMAFAVLSLTGCSGGEKPQTPEMQQKRLESAEESMKKGMESMKGMKGMPGSPQR
jgi:hypothetical protein